MSAALRKLATLAIVNMENAIDVAEDVESNAMEHIQTAFVADTPCWLVSACKLLELSANKCSYHRDVVSKLYDSFNSIVHVFSTVMFVTCGCVMVGAERECVVPEIVPLGFTMCRAWSPLQLALWSKSI